MLTRSNHLEVCSVDSGCHIWTYSSPVGSVEHSNDVSRNQYASPFQSTLIVEERAALDYSSTLLDWMK